MKHVYHLSGITRVNPIRKFDGYCVATDIIEAIELFRSKMLSPHSVQRCSQVEADRNTSIIGITYTDIDTH